MGGCLYEPCFALITRTQGAGARRAITFVTLLAGFAGTLSFPLNHWLAEGWSWHAATWTFAALLAFVAAPLLWLGGHDAERDAVAERSRRQRPGMAPSRGSGASRRILRKPAFWLLAAGFSLLGADHGVIVNHLLPILQERGMRPDLAVLAASMIGPMQVCGRLAMMASERHLSSRAMTTLCFVFVLARGRLPVRRDEAAGAARAVRRPSGQRLRRAQHHAAGDDPRDPRAPRISARSAAPSPCPISAAYALAPFLGSLIWKAGGYGLVIGTVAGMAALGLLSFRLSLRASAGADSAGEPLSAS